MSPVELEILSSDDENDGSSSSITKTPQDSDVEIDGEPPVKKSRKSDASTDEEKEKSPSPEPVIPIKSYVRCKICKQIDDETTPKFTRVKFISENTGLIKTEREATTDPKFMVEGWEGDQLHDFYIDDFSIYDKNDHLIHLDSDLIKKKVEIKFSGKLKPFFSFNEDQETTIPIIDCGPIRQWWLTGYNEGEQMSIGITTEHGQYYLKNASIDYGDVFNVLTEKLRVTKTVFSCLRRVLDKEDGGHENYTYDELQEDIGKETNLELNEQVSSYLILFSCSRYE